MKLLIVTQHFWPESFIINNLAKALVKEKVKIQVLTGKPNYISGKIKKKYKPWLVSRDKYEGIAITRVPIISRGNKSALRLILNYLSFIISGCLFSLPFLKDKKFDYILVYGTSPLLQSLIAIFLKSVLKKKLIIWVQDLWPEVLLDTKYIQNRVLLNVINFIVKFIYSQTDLVLAQSDAFKNHLKNKYKINNIITFENPGIKTDIKIKKRNNKKKIILYTGNIGKAQPFYKILNIAKKLKKNNQFIFKIIGGGSDYDWLKEQIKHHNLKKIIILKSFKNQKLLKKDFDEADFLLILLSKGLSFSKTIPNKFQNYLSIGKPILCIGSGQIQKKIIQNKLGIVFDKKKDISKFFNNLSILKNRNYKNYYYNNKKYFKSNYDLTKKAKKLIKIIQAIN